MGAEGRGREGVGVLGTAPAWATRDRPNRKGKQAGGGEGEGGESGGEREQHPQSFRMQAETKKERNEQKRVWRHPGTSPVRQRRWRRAQLFIVV